MLSLLCLSLILAGCANTEQNTDVQPSGFLKDYTQFKKGGEDRAALYFIDDSADYSGYTKILLDPITIWRSTDSDLENMPKVEADNLMHIMYQALLKHLVSDYKFVKVPGKDVMRMRLAFTEGKGGNVVLDILTTFLPPARLISEGVHLANGTYGFVGSATIEMEILDSVSGKRLIAIVDQRQGTKTYEASLSTWGDIEKACDFWAQRAQERLGQAREGKLTFE